MSSLVCNAQDKNIFNHLDVGVTAGTSGFGLNLSVPVTDYVKLRAGVDFMPRFVVPMTFDIGTYVPTPSDAEDPQAWQDQHFEAIRDVMYQLSGIEVDRKVRMKTSGRMLDFKFLVDVYPWQDNKHWHLTAGFYWGSAKVAHTENNAEVMPALLAMKIYNNFYEYVMNTDFFDEPVYKDVYLDPDMADMIKDRVADYGRIGVHLGYVKSDGRKFMMEPGKDGMVKANMFVNHFKPYIGFGYNAPITKDGRWNVGFDAGLLFWGSPKLYTHEMPLVEATTVDSTFGDKTYNVHLGVTTSLPDGTNEAVFTTYDLINEIDRVDGKVGHYVDIASFFKVWPVINFKISFTIF